MNHKLSIIIVNYHNETVLEHCLRSLHVATKHPFEIILVDNSPTEQVQQILKESGWTSHYFPQAENIGYAAAVNYGVAHAAGDYVCLLHPDTILEAHAIDRLVDWVAQRPRTIAGPRERNAHGQIVTSVFPQVSRRQLWGERLWHPSQWPVKWYYALRWFMPTYRYARLCETASVPVQVPVLASTCLVMERRTWATVGDFDVELYKIGLEAEWFRRARVEASTAWFIPSAEILHDAGHSHRQLPNWIVREATIRDRRRLATGFGILTVLILGLMLWLEDRFRSR